jgi:hypothetical protein
MEAVFVAAMVGVVLALGAVAARAAYRLFRIAPLRTHGRTN